MVNISSAIQNGSKYLARQARDIAIYGEKKVIRTASVTEEILQNFTPHRRLSKKPCTLNDNRYFLDKFEKETQLELPKLDDWNSLSVEEKIDYIVKGRYRRLVANKIMNVIRYNPVEHNYMLSENGEILAHNVGNSKRVNIKEALDFANELFEKRVKLEEQGGKFLHLEAEVATTGIHNHPPYYPELVENLDNKTKNIFEECFDITPKAEVNPISKQDILGDVENITDGFVVDSLGHKFHFVPKQHTITTAEEYENVMTMLSEFEYKANGIDYNFRAFFEAEKNKLERLIASGNYTPEMLKEQQAKVIKAYADKLKELLTQEEYRKFLTSDFVKENIGIFKELP